MLTSSATLAIVSLSHLLHKKLHWLDVPQRLQYKLCSWVSAIQRSTVHYMIKCCTQLCLSAAFAVCPLLPACTASLAFDVSLLGLLCGWPNGLELVRWQCSWSDTSVWQFLAWFENFPFLSPLSYTMHQSLHDYVLHKLMTNTDICPFQQHEWVSSLLMAHQHNKI